MTDTSYRLSPAQVFARPTAEILWLGPAQRAALSQLSAATPVRVLLGPRSSGRTTLLRHLSFRDAGKTIVVSAHGKLPDTRSLLVSLLASCGFGGEGLEPDELKRVLGVYLREKLAQGKQVTLQLDDADRLDPLQFSVLQSLSEIAAVGGRKLSWVFCAEHLDPGSSMLADYVRAQSSPALAVLSWLKPEEVYRYLFWRLDRFDLADALTTDGTRLIARWSRGCFASVDYLAQLTLLLLRQRGGSRIDVGLVRDALNLSRRPSAAASGHQQRQHTELLVSLNGTLLRRVKLDDRLMIGRSPINDISLDHGALSRHHAVIVQDKSGLICNDLNSANGVFLNGQRILSSPLHDGDILELGPYRVKVRRCDSAESLKIQAAADAGADTIALPIAGELQPARLRVIR